MPRIGVTGHVGLSETATGLVFEALSAALREHAGPRPHGITCLARGSDQIFARAVLALGGTFEVMLPARDYRNRILNGQDRTTFDHLLDQATNVRTMPYKRSSRRAYLAASEAMLNQCDMLFAVWDGAPTEQLGDTAFVVSAAQRRGLPVKVLWPAGAERRR